MIVMIPLTNTLDYTEFRYALRSIEKHIPGYEVVIVGEEMPDWITNITWLHVPDVRGRKQLSIKRKIVAALEYDPEILFMNDDIFLLEKTNPKNYPFYYYGILRGQTESGCSQLINELSEMKKETKHFDIHTPIVYKKDFIDAVEHFSSDTVIKSMYGNFYNIEGVLLKDLKIARPVAPEAIRQLIKDRPCFSTGMNGVRSAEVVLKELFPKQSSFELW